MEMPSTHPLRGKSGGRCWGKAKGAVCSWSVNRRLEGNNPFSEQLWQSQDWGEASEAFAVGVKWKGMVPQKVRNQGKSINAVLKSKNKGKNP